MNSIRRKLFSQIGSLILIFTLLLYLANTFLLEPFYVHNTKNDIIKVYDIINNTNVNALSSEQLYRLSISSRSYMDVIIFDAENKPFLASLNPILEVQPQSENTNPKPPDNNLAFIDKEILDNNSSFTWYLDSKTQITILTYEGLLDNGMSLEIRIPLSSVKENISLINKFILIVGILIFFLSIIVANVISKHFTTPILNILEVTKDIKNLNFSKICIVSTNDEIGRLSENVNEMSYALKENIENLAHSNEHLIKEIDERLKIDKQRKDLLNNVSHELKTPLSLVQGYSEGLKLNLHKSPEKMDFYCDVIIDEAKKMDLLVSQLLDINHIQFGDFPLSKEKTPAREFISYIVQKYTTLFNQHGVHVTDNIQTIPDNLFLHIDSLRSEQLLTNLLNNALAYVDTNQEISIHVNKINNSNSHNHLQVTIGNSHSSIPDQELKKIWESFYKIDKARTRENGGYGLGLSIIKAIQEADSNRFGVYQKDGYIYFFVELDLI